MPFRLDHNRMLVAGQMPKADGTWRDVVLWVDTGNPEFFLSEELANDLGMDLSGQERTQDGRIKPLPVPSPSAIKIGTLGVQISGIPTKVMFDPKWLFTTMHIDANLPSTVLKNFHVVFDYPKRELTLAEPNSMEPRGEKAPATIHEQTGIVQIDATIDGQPFSFALDNGASYSYVSQEDLNALLNGYPAWPRMSGAVGCANIWGWWPGEFDWPVTRVPEIQWGGVALRDVGLAGLPNFFGDGKDLGEWYSLKSAKPVDGFLGPNAFKAFRVAIDFPNSAVYFERAAEFDPRDMDLVGLTLRPLPDLSYEVTGIARVDGKKTVDGVEPRDKLVRIDDLEVQGATMGTVVDALRGAPGDIHTLTFDRAGQRIVVQATVKRLL